MIDQRELRIGNLIQRESEIFEITGIAHRGVWATGKHLGEPIEYSQELFLKKCSPIGLTPEWLEKGGLTKDGGIQKLIFDYGICLERRDNNLYIVNDFDSKKIDYVHQWQNIYFVLKGKELEFKL